MEEPLSHLSRHSLLHDKGKAVLALEGIIELDQIHMAELVHDIDLVLHILLAEPGGGEFPRNVSGRGGSRASQDTHMYAHAHPSHILVSCFHTRSLTTQTLQQKGP